MAQTYTEKKRTIFGDLRVVIYSFDANGTASGYNVTGLDYIYGTASSNSENAAESLLVVKNSNNGTEDTLAGAIYVTAPDGTNTTADIIVFGV